MTNLFQSLARTVIGVGGALILATSFMVAATGPAVLASATQVAMHSA